MYLDSLDQIAGTGPTATGAFAPTATGQNLSYTAGFNYLDRIFPMDDGSGDILSLIIQTATAAASGGSATIQFQLIGNATDPTFSSGNVVICQTAVLAYTAVPVKERFAIPIPRNAWAGYEQSGTPVRYYTLNAQIATAVLTGGAWNAWVGPNRMGIQDNLAYPAGYSIKG